MKNILLSILGLIVLIVIIWASIPKHIEDTNGSQNTTPVKLGNSSILSSDSSYLADGFLEHREGEALIVSADRFTGRYILTEFDVYGGRREISLSSELDSGNMRIAIVGPDSDIYDFEIGSLETLNIAGVGHYKVVMIGESAEFSINLDIKTGY